MANPKLKDGYTRVAHEILEEAAKRKFNGTQFRIIMIIWRYTYGYARKDHDFARTFLQLMTELPESTIKRETTALIKAKVIIVTQKETSTQPRKLAFNKNYDQWEIPKSGEEMHNDHDLFSQSGGSDLNPLDNDSGGIGFDPPGGSDLNPRDVVLGDRIRPPYKDKDLLKIIIKDNIAMFDQFYQIYPRKIARVYAKKVWEKLCKDKEFDAELCIRNTANFTETHKLLGTDKKYIPHPSTYLNQKQYEDYEVVDPEGLTINQSKKTGSVLNRMLKEELMTSEPTSNPVDPKLPIGSVPELYD